jgi:ribosome biogenesis GTPase A
MRQELIKILHKNLRAMKDKEQLMVGVVGYPNTGKSSLVNLLRHSNATNVGTEPGTTKTTIIVDIDKKVSMLDCPGVIPKTEDDAGKAGLVLRHACKIDQSQVDPVPIVLELLEKVQMIDVLKLYHLGQYKTGQEMLQQLARKKGQLRQATVSIADAARTVLRDFSNGKFKYFTQVPKHGMEDDSD